MYKSITHNANRGDIYLAEPNVVKLQPATQEYYLYGSREGEIPLLGAVTKGSEADKLIQEQGLQPVEAFRLKRDVGDGKDYLVMYSQVFYMADRPARIAYTIVEEKYGPNDKYTCQRVVPTVVYQSNSHGLWKTMRATIKNGAHIVKNYGNFFNEYDQTLPWEIQQYLLKGEGSNSIRQKLSRLIRRVASPRVTVEELIRCHFVPDITSYQEQGFDIEFRDMVKNRIEIDPYSILDKLAAGSGEVISAYNTQNSLYGNIEVRVVRVDSIIITLLKTKYGIHVGHMEYEGSPLSPSCINETSIAGPGNDIEVIRDILAPSVDHSADLGIRGRDRYVSVPRNRIPKLTQDFRKAAEQYFYLKSVF